MTTRLATFIYTMTTSILGWALLSILVTAPPLFAEDAEHENHHPQSQLVRDVRNATKPFLDINNLPQSYQPVFGCVSGPDHGAMGIHYVDLGLVGDGKIDLTKPEAVIYEPVGKA